MWKSKLCGAFVHPSHWLISTQVLDQWVAHIGRAGGDVFVYAGAAREKLEARLALYSKQPAERAKRGDRTLYVVMDRYGLQTAVKHAVDFSAPKACALFPDVATDDLLRLGVLKMAKQDPRKFKKKLDAGDFGSLPPGLVDSVQLEKGGTDDESTMISDIVQTSPSSRPSAASATTGTSRRNAGTARCAGSRRRRAARCSSRPSRPVWKSRRRRRDDSARAAKF